MPRSSAPSSLESLRRGNRMRVMGLLQQLGHASRAEIVRRSGLSRSTVSSLVAELLEEGLVIERTEWAPLPPSPDGGRPATLLTLNPASGAFFGVDFAHDSVRSVLVDRSGQVLADAQASREVAGNPTGALEAAMQQTRELLAQAGVDPARVLGAGVAVSAPLRSDGPTHLASNRIFAGWAGVELETELSARLGCAVQVGNDANLGAIAECTFGAGRGARNVLYVMLGAGVGLGLWLRGELYTGEAGTAGELGHVVVVPDGQICRCGNRGCLETVASVGALTRALGYARGSDLDATELLQLARHGDAGTMRLLGDAGRAVGRALAGVCSILDPGLIVVGGELAAAGEPLLVGIREMIERDTSPTTGRAYEVVCGALGARAEALGAAALAMDSESRQMLHSGGALAPV